MARRTNATLIAELRHFATLESADFSRLPPHDWRDALPTKEDEVTPFIRARTRVWRETWIVPLIAELEARLVKPRKRKAARNG